MKLTIVSLLFFTFQVSAKSYAQKITIVKKNASLAEIFKAIERQTGFLFFYDKAIIQKSGPVDISIKDATLEEALSACLQGSELTYSIVKNTVVIMPDKTTVFFPTQTTLTPMEAPEPPPIEIYGQVVNSEGEPLPNVSVIIVGTNIGTTTNSNGRFILTASNDINIILEVSSVGYRAKRVNVGNQTEINVVLELITSSLEDVVVVGYGTQKKVNLTGSISSVKTDEIIGIPTPTITQALMGKMSGVFIKNQNGQPGDGKGIDLNIRGFGTPLIIIDGIPSTKEILNNLDPSDIEEFNVLKDAASAAVYGAQAGNGVVLVKTRRGQVSDAVVSYLSNYGLQFFTRIPKRVSTAQYFEMQNLANFNAGLAPIWTDEEIRIAKEGSDLINYPNTNWWDETFRKFSPQQQHNINIRGGTEKVRYFVSGGLFHQDGALRTDDIKYNRYNVRSNLDISVTKNLKMGIDISLNEQDYIGPRNNVERIAGAGGDFGGTTLGIMTMVNRARSYFAVYPPGTDKSVPILNLQGVNPTSMSEIDFVGYRKWDNLFLDSKINFAYDLPFGVHAKAVFSFDRTHKANKVKIAKVPLYSLDSEGKYSLEQGYFTNPIASLSQTEYKLQNLNQQYFLSWNKHLNNHNIDALLVFERLFNTTSYVAAERTRYTIDMDYLFAGPTLDATNNGSATEDGREGFISRISYNYKQKYLLEINSRYDASSRFPKNTRWGFFPSISGGWRISEENFMKSKMNFVDNLKLRASYGNLGYDAAGNFQFLSTYSFSGGYIYGNNIFEQGIKADQLPNPNITWEKMSISNVGVDFSLWGNRLSGSFDYFYRLRTNVLGSRSSSLPNIVGAAMPQVNYAKYDNRGWELSLKHENSINNFRYEFGGNISWNREKTVFIDQIVFANAEARRRGNKVGQWTDVFWGIQTDGLFQSKEEIDNWADIDGKNNASLLPGDVKMIDYNGDGRITAEDNVIIGSGSYPRFTYGINVSIAWKNFDFGMLWQGAGMYNFDLSKGPDYSRQFYGSMTPLQEWYNHTFTPENPWVPTNTKNARWPLWRAGAELGNTSFQSSQFWLIDGSYIRLKNIDFGYTFSLKVFKKMNLNKARIFLSGYNVLTIFPLDFMDPEVDVASRAVFGDYYPQVGVYSLGIDIKF